MRPQSTALLAAVLVASCSSLERVEIPLERIEGMSTIVVGFESSDGSGVPRVEMIALDPSRSEEVERALTVRDSGDESLKVTAFHLPESLDELGISSPDLAANSGSFGRTLLTSEVSIRSFLVSSSEPTGWVSVDKTKLSPELQRATSYCSDRARCATFEPSQDEHRRIPDRDRDPSLLVLLEDGRALVGTGGGGSLFLVDLPGSGAILEAPPLAASCPRASAPPSEGAFRPEGSRALFLGGAQGELWRVRIETDRIECLGAWTSSVAERLRWMDGRASSDAVELYIRTIEGAFLRFDGETFQLLHRFNYVPESDLFGGVAYVGPGEAFGAAVSDPELAHVRADRVDRVLVLDNRDGFSAIAQIPGLGVVAATGVSANFYLLEEESRSWRHLPQRPKPEERIANSVGAIIGFEEGFLAGATQGFVLQYIHGPGFCARPKEATASDSIRFFQRMDDSTLLSVGPRALGIGQGAAVSILRVGSSFDGSSCQAR